jgi:CRISPR type I-E-associated protein CasB/Cse2
MFIPSYHMLRFDLLSSGFSVQNEKLASVVGLAARVKTNVGSTTVARQMGEPRGGKQARVAELRFRRLLELDGKDTEELYRLMIRLLPLVGEPVNLLDLVNSIYGWGDFQRKRWALEYYSAVPEKKAKA